MSINTQVQGQSFPSRERGLKRKYTFYQYEDKWSFPSRERGLKRFVGLSTQINHKMSFPSRERGLKHALDLLCNPFIGSFPSRERGLKLQCSCLPLR